MTSEDKGSEDEKHTLHIGGKRIFDKSRSNSRIDRYKGTDIIKDKVKRRFSCLATCFVIAISQSYDRLYLDLSTLILVLLCPPIFFSFHKIQSSTYYACILCDENVSICRGGHLFIGLCSIKTKTPTHPNIMLKSFPLTNVN